MLSTEKVQCAEPTCPTLLSRGNVKIGLCFIHQDKANGEISGSDKTSEIKKSCRKKRRLEFRIDIQPSNEVVKNPSIQHFIRIIAHAYNVDTKEITEKRTGGIIDQWPRTLAAYLALRDRIEPECQILVALVMSPPVLKTANRTVTDYMQDHPEMVKVVEEIRTRYVLSSPKATVKP